MILVDCSVGPPSFLQVNESGGEPCEVQFNVRGDPTEIVMGDDDDDGLLMIGAAIF